MIPTEVKYPGNLDIFLQLSRDRNDLLLQRADGLATKAVAVFGVAALVLTFMASGAQTVVLFSGFPPALASSALIAGLVLFGLTAFCTFMVYRVQYYREGPNPQTLLQKYIDLSEEEVKYWVIHYFGEWWSANRSMLYRNARWLQAGLIFASLEVVALVIWLVF